MTKIFSRIFQFIGVTLTTTSMMFFSAFGATLIAHGVVNLNFWIVVLGIASLYINKYCLRLLIYFVKKLEDL